MVTERACVMVIDQDFLYGQWSVSCFCGWEADTVWDDREGAESEWRKHRGK